METFQKFRYLNYVRNGIDKSFALYMHNFYPVQWLLIYLVFLNLKFDILKKKNLTMSS